MSFEGPFSFSAEKPDFYQRLDTAVAFRLAECSRTYAASLVRDGLIKVNGNAVKPGYRLKPGDTVVGEIPPPETPDLLPEAIPLEFLYEDDQIAVINKAAGMVVHPAPGHYTGTVVNALLHSCPDIGRIGGDIRPGIVHRLDKDTSGALVIAKNGSAHEDLSRQFKERTVKKQYIAVVHGRVKKNSGAIRLPVGRHPVDRKKMSVHGVASRRAETVWRVRERYQDFSALDLDLKTGRTHQIRVHCAAIHHPVVGDDIYGSRYYGSARNAVMEIKQLIGAVKRQMLHARCLQLVHPTSREFLAFEAPVPADMQGLMDDLARYSG